jgi:hypothetical protein
LMSAATSPRPSAHPLISPSIDGRRRETWRGPHLLGAAKIRVSSSEGWIYSAPLT